MENTSYIALSRQTALWRQLEAVANNMANVNTPGYKGEQVMFKEYLVTSKDSDHTFGEKVAFVHDVGTVRDTREGPLTHTNDPLDMALRGDGYFAIDTPNGPRYSRHGHFHLDETGMVVTSAGFPVMQTNGQPIIVAPGEARIEVLRDGTVTTENGEIGKLRVVRFENEQALRKAGDGLYMAAAEGQDAERPDVVQGMIEESNVQPVIELTNMMTILRSYEGVQKMIENEHERQMKAMQTLAGGGQRSA